MFKSVTQSIPSRGVTMLAALLFLTVVATAKDAQEVRRAPLQESLAATNGIPAKGTIPVDFKLKRAGRVSVNIFCKDGTLAHQLVTGQPMTAGNQRLFWDGCDDAGKPVAVGEYEVRGLCSNVRSVWDGKVANSSPEAGSEWKQYRTELYTAALALPGGGVVTLSGGGEHGRVVQRLGGPPDYPVRWTSTPSSPAVAAAADGKYVYAVFSHEEFFDEALKKKRMREALARIRLDDGMVEPYADGATAPGAAVGQRWLDKAHAPLDPNDIWAPTGRYLPFGEADVLGIAARAGKLYVTHHAENRIGVLDAVSGKEVATFTCPQPRKIALDAQGRLYVTSGLQLLRLNADGAGQTVVADGFEYACGVAVGPDGSVYVTDLGNAQQVKVYKEDIRGQRTEVSDQREEGKGSGYKLVKTFGVKGGFQQGRVALDLLQGPYEVSVGPDGTIVIPDAGGGRVLVLTKDFLLRKEITGRMPYCCFISDLDPSLVYHGRPCYDLNEYKVDYAAKTATLTRRWPFRLIWKHPSYDLPFNGSYYYPFNHGKLFFRQWGGRTFILSPANGFVAELTGDKLDLRVWLGQGKVPASTVNDGVSWDLKQPQKAWVWRDKNMDGVIQASEIEIGDWPAAGNFLDGYLDAAGNLYIPAQSTTDRGVLKVPFGGLDEQGLPKYTWTNATWAMKILPSEVVPSTDGKTTFPFIASTYFPDTNGNVYLSENPDSWDTRADMAIRKYAPDGRLLWRVGRRQRGAAQKPGEINAAYNFSGLVDNRYLFYIDYDGSMNCWDSDGLFVAHLFSDLPDNLFLPGECFFGVAFRHPNGKVYAYSSPDCQYCSTRIVVEGLENVERFGARVAVAEVLPPRPVVDDKREWGILRRAYPILIDGDVSAREWSTDTSEQAPEVFRYKDQEAARAFMQWDDEALYLAWKIVDDTPAVNKQQGGQRWEGDQVEFMIRAATGAASAGSGSYDAQEYQLAIGPDKDGKVAVFVQANGSDKAGKLLPGTDVALQVTPDKKGYTMEARLPWASLGSYRPKVGDLIHVNMQIDWGTSDGSGWDHALKWTPGIHWIPANWGTAVFK